MGKNRTHNFKTYILSNSACWIYVCVTTTGSTLLVNWQCHVMGRYYMLTDTVTCWVDLGGWLPVSRAGSTILVDWHCHVLGRPCWLNVSTVASIDITSSLPLPSQILCTDLCITRTYILIEQVLYTTVIMFCSLTWYFNCRSNVTYVHLFHT